RANAAEQMVTFAKQEFNETSKLASKARELGEWRSAERIGCAADLWFFVYQIQRERFRKLNASAIETNNQESWWCDADTYIRGICVDLIREASIEGYRSTALMAIRSLRSPSISGETRRTVKRMKQMRVQIHAAWKELKGVAEHWQASKTASARIAFDQLSPA